MRNSYSYKVYGDLVDPEFLDEVETIGFPHAEQVAPEVRLSMQEKVKRMLKLHD